MDLETCLATIERARAVLSELNRALEELNEHVGIKCVDCDKLLPVESAADFNEQDAQPRRCYDCNNREQQRKARLAEAEKRKWREAELKLAEVQRRRNMIAREEYLENGPPPLNAGPGSWMAN